MGRNEPGSGLPDSFCSMSANLDNAEESRSTFCASCSVSRLSSTISICLRTRTRVGLTNSCSGLTSGLTLVNSAIWSASLSQSSALAFRAAKLALRCAAPLIARSFAVALSNRWALAINGQLRIIYGMSMKVNDTECDMGDFNWRGAVLVLEGESK